MAIPTQFSVTKTRKCPIANPTQPIDEASTLTAEWVGFISGASALPVKSAGDIDAPVEIAAESAITVDNASLFSALSVGEINNPSLVTAKTAAPVDDASLISAESQPSVALPSAASAESAPSIATPNALTANAGTPISGPFPLNHARILYNNKLFGYESVTSVKGVPLNALTPNTWQRWIFDSSTTSSGIRIDLPSAVTIDCICIGAHNLGAIGATVSLSYSTDGTTFVDWSPDFDVGGRAAIMSYTQTPKQVKAIQVFIQAGTTATGYIGYISAGEALQMQRPFFNGHQPYTDSDVTEYYSNRTESGNIIGRQIRRRGYETTYEWQNIDDTWYRNNIPVFKDYAKRYPMFIAWNLLEFPDDVAFGETTGDIATSMQNGTRIKRTGLSFTLKGV